MKLYKDICSAWISHTTAEIFFSQRLKNTIDLLFFYGEHFYGFSESDLRKRWKKETFISQQTSL